MLHQSKRCESGAGEALSSVVVIGWLSPVWITLKLAVNACHARRLASRLAYHLVHIPANRIVIAGGKVGVVRVKALHPTRRPPDASARAALHTCGKLRVAVARIARMRGLDRCA
jgi:hypothetical protein